MTYDPATRGRRRARRGLNSHKARRNRGEHMNSSRLGRLFASALVLGAVLAGFTLLSAGSDRGVVAARSRPALYSPGEESGEMSRTAVEQYWQARLTYPTGRFDQRWIADAAKQARRIKVGIPE